jgi:hypothetical protein
VGAQGGREDDSHCQCGASCSGGEEKLADCVVWGSKKGIGEHSGGCDENVNPC